MTKKHIQLKSEDKQYLRELIKQSTLEVRTFKRAVALLALDEGATLQAAGEVAGLNYNSVARWRDRYRAEGLMAALADRPKSGRPVQIDGQQRAKITALACSQAPEGYSEWNLRLLADKVVELGYCDAISHTHVGSILKKTT